MKEAISSFRRLILPASLILPVCFIPPSVHAETQEIQNLSNRLYFNETLQAIQKANESIFLLMYHLPVDPSNPSSPVTRLVDALIQAKMRGVEVRVILDQEIRTERSRKGVPMKNLRAYHVLKENGISVSFDSLGKRTHAKLLVIDREIVILGSTNWSREALDENYEANLLVRSPETASAILEDFKAIELLEIKRGLAPFDSQESLRISRNFLLDKNQGPRLLEEHAERALRLYLVLISKSTPTITVDYDETAKLLGLELMSREAYRRQIIKVLKKLDRDYKLIRFEPKHGKGALVTLLSPKRGQAPFEIPKEDYFEIPRGFFSAGWLTTLSLRAQYSLLILYDQASYPRTSPTIQVGMETLEKRYFVSRKTLGEGFQELARQNLLEIYYGKTIDFAKKEFETASYVLLPFYDPKALGQQLKRLEALYGKYAFEQAQRWAGAFFKERDPAMIETLLGLRLTYPPEWVDLAMNKVILEKDVGNPARSLPYLIGILKKWKEEGRTGSGVTYERLTPFYFLLILLFQAKGNVNPLSFR